jgi:hypothetical protein
MLGVETLTSTAMHWINLLEMIVGKLKFPGLGIQKHPATTETWLD